jgi:hypothetical protein
MSKVGQSDTFAIEKPHKIVEITKDDIEMESEVADMRHLL